MNTEAFNQYVEERYKPQMLYYKTSSAGNQKKYKRFQWALIILSALTPVIAALGNIKPTFLGVAFGNLNAVVVIVSSVVAILTTGLKTFNYQEDWIRYRSTYEQLKPEIYFYSSAAGPYAEAGVDKESLFVTRVEAILNAEHQQWPPAKTFKEQLEKASDEAK